MSRGHRDCPDSARGPLCVLGFLPEGCLGVVRCPGRSLCAPGQGGGPKSPSSGARRMLSPVSGMLLSTRLLPHNLSHSNWDQFGWRCLPGSRSPLRGGMQGCRDAEEGGKEGGPGVEEAGPAPSAAAPAPARAAMPERSGLGGARAGRGGGRGAHGVLPPPPAQHHEADLPLCRLLLRGTSRFPSRFPSRFSSRFPSRFPSGRVLRAEPCPPRPT